MYAVVCTITRVCYPRALSLSRSTQVLHVFLNVDRLWRRVGRFVFFFNFYVQMTLFGALTMRKIKEGFIVKKASSLPLRNTKKRKEADQRTRIELSQNLLTRARETYASARNLRDAFYFNAFARGYLCSLLPRPAEATLSARSRSQRFRTEFVEARSISYLARLVEDATRKQFRETPGVPFQKNARETARAHFLNGTTGFTPNSSARARNFVAILLFP